MEMLVSKISLKRVIKDKLVKKVMIKIKIMIMIMIKIQHKEKFLNENKV